MHWSTEQLVLWIGKPTALKSTPNPEVLVEKQAQGTMPDALPTLGEVKRQQPQSYQLQELLINKLQVFVN